MRRLRLQAVVGPGAGGHAAQRLRAAPTRSSPRARSPAPSRMPRWCCRRSPATTRAIRTASRPARLRWRRTRGDLTGKRIAYSPDFGVYPVDPARRGGRRVARSRRSRRPARRRGAWRSASRTTSASCADLWCRLIIAAQHRHVRGVQGGRASTCCGDHRDAIAARVPCWRRSRPGTAERDRHDPRPGDAHARSTTPSQRVARRLRPPRHTHGVGGPGRQRDDGDTIGPHGGRRRRGRPAASAGA